MSHLFIRHYVTTILNRPSPVIPPAMFTQIFFTSVFQLLMGNQITNKKAMSEEFRQDIETAFAAFRATYGPSGSGPLCPPVSSAVSRRRPITFGLALASTAIQCSKDWRTLVVEGVPDCFIKLISTKLRRLVPELKHGHARPYALYVYDTIAQDPKFVPELPNIASMSADLKAKVQSKFDYVINDCNALLDPAIRQIQNELQDIRALAEERQRHQAFQRACRATPSTANPAASSSSSSNVPPSLAFDPLTSADIDSEDAMSLDMAESISTVIGLDHLHLQSIAGSDSDNASSIAPDALDDQHDAITNNSNNNVMLTTATLSRWPHLFLPIMANVLQTLESWNNHDNELPPALQTEASLSWVRHVLSEVPDWKKIGHQKRTRLVSAIAKVINDSSTPFDARKLPRSFDAESRDIIKGLVENAKRQLNEGSFAPATYLYSPPSRLFPLLPVPSFRLRFVRINSSTMGTLLNHFGIKPPLACPSVGPPVENASEPLDSPHKNFDLLDLSKFKNRGVFEDSIMSDGHSVSVTFKKLKPIDQEEPLSLEDINADDLADCRVWGVDPGVGQIFVAVDGSDPSVYDVEGAMASDPPHEIRRYSSKEYFHNAGFHRTNQRIRDLKSQHGIDTLESTIPSPCTMDLSKLDLYTKAVLERAQLLKDFYAEHLPPLRFLNYRGRQKTDGELVNIFLTGGNKYGRQSDRELVDLTVPEGNVSMQSPQEEQVDMDAYEHDGPHVATTESALPLALSPVLSAPPHATSQPSVGTNPTSRATAIATAHGAIAIAIAEGYAPSIRISIDNPQPQEPMQTGTRATTTLQQVTPPLPLISTQPSLQMGRGSATSIADSQNAIAIAIAGNRAPSINISSGSSTSQDSLPIENDNPSVSIIGTSSEPSVAVDVGDTALALASTSPLFLQPMIDSSSRRRSETAPSPHAPQSFANEPDVLTDVNTPPPLPRQKWRKQEFVATPKSKVTLVCLGDGKFGRRSFRGHPSGLAARLKKLLQRADREDRLVLLSTDEKWTSQVCSKCGRQGCKPIEIAGSNLHSVTVCQHCGQMWQRDCNAARNILSVARLAIEGASRPQVLSQKVTDQDGDVQGAPNDPDPMDNPPPTASPIVHNENVQV